MKRILVVDDEPTILKNVAQSLRRDGFEVLAVPDSANARWTLRERKVDALCLDVNLPDGSGLDLLEEVRRFVPDLPVIVISGVPTAQNKARAAALGAQMFLEKPFALSKLRKILRQCLDLDDIRSR